MVWGIRCETARGCILTIVIVNFLIARLSVLQIIVTSNKHPRLIRMPGCPVCGPFRPAV